jgi:thioredoxin reductase
VVDAIEVDSTLSTSVEGVYAAGDASTQQPSVANAVSAGSIAAASVVQSLI